MKKQAKTRVPQAQNWKPKTTQSRATNKKKKVINAQVQTQTQTKVGYIPPYNYQKLYNSIKWPKSMFATGNPFSSSVLTMQDIINFWQNLQNTSQPPMGNRSFDTYMYDDLVDKEEKEEFSPLLLLKAILSSNKEIRINRKCFKEAMDFEIEIETEHDEDFVVIRRK